jgi:hypothetical protein
VALTNRVRSAISRVGAALARVSRIARRHFVTIGGRSRRDLFGGHRQAIDDARHPLGVACDCESGVAFSG